MKSSIIIALISIVALFACSNQEALPGNGATNRYDAKVWDATAAEWAADKTIYKQNDVLFCTDCPILKRGDGVHVYSALPELGGTPDKTKSDSLALATMINTKITRTGDNMTGALGISYAGANKHLIAMNLGGNSSSGSTSFGQATYYLGLGHREWGAGTWRLIGFGFRYTVNDHYPAVLGYQETSTSSSTYGDLVFATRNVNSNTAPTIRLRITGAGIVKGYFAPAAAEDMTTKVYVDSAIAKAVRAAIDSLKK